MLRYLHPDRMEVRQSVRCLWEPGVRVERMRRVTSGSKQSWEVDEEKSEELRLVSGMSHFLSGCI